MKGLIIVLTHGTDAPEQAMRILRTARAAQQEGHKLVLWMSGEGVRLGVQGVAETLREPGPETAAEILDALMAGGARMWLEDQSYEEREYEYEAARPGAEIVPPTRLARLLGKDWMPLGA